MSGLLASLVELNIAAAAAILFVLLARAHVTRAFGPHAAYALWSMVPVAMLATLLPERTTETLVTEFLIGGLPASLAMMQADATPSWLPLAISVAWIAGAIALAYEQAGGVVEWFGKPHPPAYQACFALLPGMERARIVAIGDSLRTDIAGAERMNLDSILIPGGIHAGELGIGADGLPDAAKLDVACAKAGIRPTFVMPSFRW